MSRENVTRKYQGQEGQLYHQMKHGVPEERYAWVARDRARKIQRYVSGGDVVFEYGVGTGWNLAALECRVKIGYDISESVAEIVEKHMIKFVDDTSLIAENSVDVGICHHVLEHVPSPIEVLDSVRKKLRRDGKLLLFAPYQFERRYRHFSREDTDHHIYSWNVQTLSSLVESTNLRVNEARIGPFGYETFAAVHSRLGEGGYHALIGILRIIRPVYEIRIVAQKT